MPNIPAYSLLSLRLLKGYKLEYSSADQPANVEARPEDYVVKYLYSLRGINLSLGIIASIKRYA
jgi:hypothetical protein